LRGLDRSRLPRVSRADLNELSEIRLVSKNSMDRNSLSNCSSRLSAIRL